MANPFSTEGRTRRRTYLLMLIAIDVLGTVLNFVLRGTTPGEAVIAFAAMLLLIWPLYCAMSRRLHDADRTSTSAFMALGLVIMGSFLLQTSRTLGTEQMGVMMAMGSILVLAAAGVSLFILFVPPTRGANRYGEDPRRPFIETPVDGRPPIACDGA